MFADAPLAARIDRAEARLCAGVAEVVHQRRPDYRILVSPISGGLAVYASPQSPVNKVIGIGFEGPLDFEALDAIEAEWRDRGEPVRFELSILADPTIPPALTERGYVLHGYENVLGQALSGDAAPSGTSAGADGPTVEPLQDADEQAWLRIAVDAFMNLDGTGSAADDAISREAMEEVLSDFAGAPGFQRYLARVDGRPVGVGSLRIDGDLAQIAGAGTLPDARGRGVQKALLRRRLDDARAAGATLAVVTTAPGTRSQENVMRRGFVLLYTRAILVKRWE